MTEQDALGRLPDNSQPGAFIWEWTALAIGFVALLGSLWLSMAMNLKACPLCLYQRTFVMGVVGVLGVGVLTAPLLRDTVSLLALPSAVGGFGVAVFHEYLELTGKLECPSGVLGIGTAPQQSLLVLTLLLVPLVAGSIQSVRHGCIRWSAICGAGILGLLFAAGAIASAPPMPPSPTAAYETPLEMCRPPFKE